MKTEFNSKFKKPSKLELPSSGMIHIVVNYSSKCISICHLIWSRLKIPSVPSNFKNIFLALYFISSTFLTLQELFYNFYIIHPHFLPPQKQHRHYSTIINCIKSVSLMFCMFHCGLASPEGLKLCLWRILLSFSIIIVFKTV